MMRREAAARRRPAALRPAEPDRPVERLDLYLGRSIAEVNVER
jgi:hypothetical protein